MWAARRGKGLKAMKMKIVCVGRIKEKFYRDALAEYDKRLGRYCKFEIVEVPNRNGSKGKKPRESYQRYGRMSSSAPWRSPERNCLRRDLRTG